MRNIFLAVDQLLQVLSLLNNFSSYLESNGTRDDHGYFTFVVLPKIRFNIIGIPLLFDQDASSKFLSKYTESFVKDQKISFPIDKDNNASLVLNDFMKIVKRNLSSCPRRKFNLTKDEIAIIDSKVYQTLLLMIRIFNIIVNVSDSETAPEVYDEMMRILGNQ